MGLRYYAALKVSDRLNPPLGNGEAWGSRLFDRRCLALTTQETRRETKATEGSTPGPGLARRAFPVNGERRPRASIQSGRETTLGPRVVHYSLRCPSLFPLLSSPLTAAESSSPFSLSPQSILSSLFLGTSVLPYFIIFYFVIVITVIIIMCWLL